MKKTIFSLSFGGILQLFWQLIKVFNNHIFSVFVKYWYFWKFLKNLEKHTTSQNFSLEAFFSRTSSVLQIYLIPEISLRKNAKNRFSSPFVLCVFFSAATSNFPAICGGWWVINTFKVMTEYGSSTFKRYRKSARGSLWTLTQQRRNKSYARINTRKIPTRAHLKKISFTFYIMKQK